VRTTSGPDCLPGGPLVAAVHSHLNCRRVALETLFARHRRHATAAAGGICSQVLLPDPVAGTAGRAWRRSTFPRGPADPDAPPGGAPSAGKSDTLPARGRSACSSPRAATPSPAPSRARGPETQERH
jgi:hypothetical protein